LCGQLANFLHHESCPKCGSRDNLAKYDDGSGWCFGCGYYQPATGFSKPIVKEMSDLPDDLDTVIREDARRWLELAEVSVEYAILHGLRWSESKQQLFFIWKDKDKKVILWQARNFYPNPKLKCFTQGNIKECLPIYHNKKYTDLLIIVEDPLSALKISLYNDAMSLLGSTIPLAKLNRLKRLYTRLIIWLDHDKGDNAIEIAEQCRLLGLSTNVCITDKDPKYCDVQKVLDNIKI
jgi:hypothetical protein